MTLVDRAAAVKAELVRITPLAIADVESPSGVLVCTGHPGVNMPDDVMSWGRIYTTQDFGPMSSTNRARDVTYNFELTASVFRGGGPDVEAIAEARAHTLISAVEEYVRVTDTTLAGLVWWCFCTSLDSSGSTDPQTIAKGRTIEVLATFTARARITN